MIRIIVTSIVFLLLAGCTLKVGKGDPEIKDAEKEKIEQQCDAIMQAFRDDSVDEAMAMLKKKFCYQRRDGGHAARPDRQSKTHVSFLW